jgi:glucose-1-phosphate adenylyltransferase
MDYRVLMARHIESRADITVATLPVPRKDVPGFGIMRMGPDRRITDFVEKPKDPAVQDAYRLSPESLSLLEMVAGEERFLASMGIYVFNRRALEELLDETHHDFGKDIIPRALPSHRVCAYVFQGAWEDIGTIRNFFDVSLDMTAPLPRFNFFDMSAPVFTRPRYLPSSKINGGNLEHSLVSDGCIIDYATLRHSILGLRSIVKRGCHIERTVVMGNDFYEPTDSVAYHLGQGLPTMGIGHNTRIENAIVDKNTRIGDNCVISPAGKPREADHALYYIRDGIVIIPKNVLIPHGTVI